MRFVSIIALLLTHSAVVFAQTPATIGRIARADPALDNLIPADARIEVLAGGFTWTEGPVWVEDEAGGHLLFSDIPRNSIFRWTESRGLTTDHRIVFGLEAHTDVKLSKDAFRSVVAAIPEAAEGVYGKVICDYLRIMWKNPTVNQKFAPGHMGLKPTDWLEELAAALEKNGRGELSRQLQSRLDQFSKPRMP